MKSSKIQLLPVVIISVILFFLSSCNAPKKAESQDQFSFAFLTDIHVQPEKNADKGFKQAIDTVNRMNPDFVITGGDQIMDALGQTESRADSLYDLYNELSSQIEMPVYNTMGNHEVFGIYEQSGVDSSHPLYGEKMYEERIGERYYAFDHKGWRFYILDSVDEKEDGSGYYGHVDSLQMAWLKEDLANVDPETPIAISVHIPFITVQTQLVYGSTIANNEGLVITNAREVLALFDEYNLKLVLQGHLHFLEDIYVKDTHFITGGAVSASWWNGPRDGMEEGFLVVHVDGEEIEWEYVDYGWEVSVNED
ncbi:MAG: metallophosphoesterase [Bacteroidota bacterium]|nr:metallophosphoesterase [Bacteroidota bacterium]